MPTEVCRTSSATAEEARPRRHDAVQERQRAEVAVGDPQVPAANAGQHPAQQRPFLGLAGTWDIDKAQNWLLAALASGRLSLDGLLTHRIQPEQLGAAYEGLLKKKDEYLGVVVHWR